MRSREYFFEAETLNRFSRDQVDPAAFDHLKEQIFDGVIDTVNASHPDGYERVLATTREARLVVPGGNVLTAYVTTADKHGLCHHLVNDDKIHWVKDDDKD